MARAHRIERCNKSPGECGRCNKEIPKGAPYYYAQPGFRNARKLIRCKEHPFRPSELTTSKMSGVYAAQEDVEDALDEFRKGCSNDLLASLKDTLSSAAEAVREVAQEYSEAAEAMGGAGESMQEKADELEEWADTLESVDAEEHVEDKTQSEDDKQEELENWHQGVIDAVEEALGACPG